MRLIGRKRKGDHGMTLNKQLKKYYHPKAVGQVLGGLMKEPHRLNDQDQPIHASYFIHPLHQTVYRCIEELASQGAEVIRPLDIQHHLEPHLIAYDHFMKQKGKEWVEQIYQYAETGSYDYYFQRVQKLACLRKLMEAGLSVKDWLNYEELDPEKLEQQETRFFNTPLETLLAQVDEKLLLAKQEFVIKGAEEGKVGEYVDDLEEEFKETKPYGFSFESELLNTTTRGFRSGAFYVESMDTSCGKSRRAVKRLMLISAPRYWDAKSKQFIKNPHGQGRATLYINSEMTRKELDTMLVPFIAGVEEDRWVEGLLTPHEKERIQEARQIAKETPIYVVVEENFDVAFLEFVISKYKTLHQIQACIFDYIELTPALMGEYSKMAKMSVREDMILLNLSAKLKSMARKYQIGLFSYTQVNDEARDNGRSMPRRDAGGVKGGKAISNKADLGMISMTPTQKEEEVIDQIMAAKGGFFPRPNLILNVYKNRGTKYRLVRLFVFQNLGNMDVIDCFATNWNYELIDLPKTKIEMDH